MEPSRTAAVIGDESRVNTLCEMYMHIGTTYCAVSAVLTKWTRIETGESIEGVTICSIFAVEDGQAILPKTLTPKEFADLVEKVKSRAPTVL